MTCRRTWLSRRFGNRFVVENRPLFAPPPIWVRGFCFLLPSFFDPPPPEMFGEFHLPVAGLSRLFWRELDGLVEKEKPKKGEERKVPPKEENREKDEEEKKTDPRKTIELFPVTTSPTFFRASISMTLPCYFTGFCYQGSLRMTGLKPHSSKVCLTRKLKSDLDQVLWPFSWIFSDIEPLRT